jgi:hypothetical protein
MSGVRVEGRVPKPTQVRSTFEAEARKALRHAATRVALPIAREEAPGGLGEALTSTVRAMDGGYRAVIQASPRKPYKGAATGAKVVRWVTHGTGLYRVGPGAKHPITSRRGVLGSMVLPGGRRVRVVRGQKPNPFLSRAQERSRGPVEQALRESARDAGRALRRL